MSTVSKSTADDLKSGKYPEDGCYLIVRYENAFNGDYAYKCYFRLEAIRTIDAITNDQLVHYLLMQILRIHGDCPKIYYIAPNVPEEVKKKLIAIVGMVEKERES